MRNFGHQLVVDDFSTTFRHIWVQLGQVHVFRIFHLSERELAIASSHQYGSCHLVEVKTRTLWLFRASPGRSAILTCSMISRPLSDFQRCLDALRCMLVCFATDSPNPPPRVMVRIVAVAWRHRRFGTVTVRRRVAALQPLPLASVLTVSRAGRVFELNSGCCW